MLEKSTKSVADQFAGQMIHFKSLPVSWDNGNMRLWNMEWRHWEHGMETLGAHGMETLGTWDGIRDNMY